MISPERTSCDLDRDVDLKQRKFSLPAKLASWVLSLGRIAARSKDKTTLQQFVRGRSAMREVFCWNGQVVAGFSLEKTRSQTPQGPASVVRVIDNQEIEEAAARISEHFGLSGYADFDFVIDEATGHAYCIEMNARPTALTHLGARINCDLGSVLQAKLHGLDLPLQRYIEPAVGTEVAIYPAEWQRDSQSDVLRTVQHDVPWDDPDVVVYYAKQRKKVPHAKSRVADVPWSDSDSRVAALCAS